MSQPQDTICSGDRCEWAPADTDIYCGFGHGRIAVLDIAPRRICLYQGTASIDQPVEFLLTNTGKVPIRIEHVGLRQGRDRHSEPMWFTPSRDRSSIEGRKLPPLGSLPWSILLPADVRARPAGYSGELVLQTSAGRESIEVLIRPAFDFDVVCVPDAVAGLGEHRIELRFEGRTGSGTIERVEADRPWARLNAMGRPETLEAGSAFALGVALVADQLAGETDRTIHLRCFVRDIDEPYEKDVPVRWDPEPELRIEGPTYCEMLAGQRDVPHKWTLRNQPVVRGTLGLEVRSVELKHRTREFLEISLPGSPAGETPAPGQSLAWGGPPRTIPSGGALEMMCVASAAESLPPGEYEAHGAVSWTWEVAGKKVARTSPFRVVLTVTELSVAGLAAMDFGTTSSCCAVADPRTNVEEFVTVETQPGSDPKVTATAVVYQRDAGADLGVRPYVFGDQARGMALNPEYQSRSVLSVKRKLGSEEPLVLVVDDYRTKLPPETVASHIMRELRYRIVHYKKYAPGDLVVTVPAMFASFERDALRKAVREAGLPLSEDPRAMVDEPIAAAAAFFFEEYPEGALPQPYSLLVCDIGGGTTDICLLRVSDRKEGGVRHLTVEIIAMGGNPQFGGDDITDALARRILGKCRELHPDLKDLPYDLVPNPTPQHQAAVEANRGDRGVWPQADDAKRALSLAKEYLLQAFTVRDSTGKTRDCSLPGHLLRLVQDDVAAAVKDDVGIVCRIIRGLMKFAQERESEKGKEKKDQEEKDRGALFRNGCPDVLYLAGRTLNIPSIRHRLEAEFGKNRSVFLPEFCKECVVRGALMIYFNEARGGRDMKFTRVFRDRCSAVAVGLGVGAGTEQVLSPIIQQFGELDEWHYAEFALPAWARIDYGAYEDYAPLAQRSLQRNPHVKYLGPVRFPIDRQRHRQAEQEHLPLVIGMKMESQGRRLKVLALIPKAQICLENPQVLKALRTPEGAEGLALWHHGPVELTRGA